MFYMLGAAVGLKDAIAPVVALVKEAVPVLLTLFCAVMGVLAVMHAFVYAKAEDPQQKQVAKQKLVNLIIAFLIAFALNVVFTILTPMMTDWVSTFTSANP